jgi:hypothetical protein
MRATGDIEAVAAHDRVIVIMDKETIQQIAAEVVARLPFGDRYWLFLAINVIVMALAAGFAAWFGSFLKTKGQNFATKRDFDELQRQLSANTKLVETVKSEVSQRDWAQREWTNLRRIKLEALIEKMHECEAYLDRCRSAAVEGSSLGEAGDVIGEFGTISDIYFPQLSKETGDFSRECRKEAITISNLGQAILKAGDNTAARQGAYDSFMAHWPRKDRILARNALRDAARTLLKRIMNVDERPAQSDER